MNADQFPPWGRIGSRVRHTRQGWFGKISYYVLGTGVFYVSWNGVTGVDYPAAAWGELIVAAPEPAVVL